MRLLFITVSCFFMSVGSFALSSNKTSTIAIPNEQTKRNKIGIHLLNQTLSELKKGSRITQMMQLILKPYAQKFPANQLLESYEKQCTDFQTGHLDITNLLNSHQILIETGIQCLTTADIELFNRTYKQSSTINHQNIILGNQLINLLPNLLPTN